MSGSTSRIQIPTLTRNDKEGDKKPSKEMAALIASVAKKKSQKLGANDDCPCKKIKQEK